MIELLTVSIGIGLAVSLLFSEMFGLAAGGMVVPGYFALFLNRPVDIALTLIAALFTYFVVHLLSTFIIVYGKRRTVLMILIGYLVRMMMTSLPIVDVVPLQWVPTEPGSEIAVIGYIIPGLIAIWIDRQGLVETLSALITASVVIRLILIIIYGVELSL
ncbi:MAG: poly-gamma-glutamate biosynthesis protein PgsC [Planctomycetales bacterium]|nr:poly-gamma-glutamate biosynthesis protein PgsC [Planctomycetales bacterium]NIM09489.1 poly-gamma-glutamate biosynthesis protein PgsC [Planctomycetales bacterium]NIN08977.1 poly-gamma-glutamate biosynthesis protein PgsC [Planctomycetales bacterium]NIN78092.1 poly-gamma-glutamate biosynthesis protein PgsC [Planctomycetales bacterium]NIO35270.1 poly-gamma-glutamate biosynthesis protein PgsC [Planctomycetales bacterium]